MGVGEDHALLAEAVDVGCRDFLVPLVQDADVAVAHVVGQDIDNVGMLGFQGKALGSQQGKRAKAKERSADPFFSF